MNRTAATADTEGETLSLLYLGGRQLVAALTLGPLRVAVNQHPLQLELQKQKETFSSLQCDNVKMLFFTHTPRPPLRAC